MRRSSCLALSRHLYGVVTSAALMACGASPSADRPTAASEHSASVVGAAGSSSTQPAADADGSNNPTSPLLVVDDSSARPDAMSGDEADPDADCGILTQMGEALPVPADIVWIIDASPSMVDELAAVEQNISAFANSIGSAGIDHHVVMLAPTDIAASTPLGADPAHYRWVLAPVDSHNALSLLVDLYDEYAAFLRPSAATHFIVVTDDDSLMAAEDFRTQMTQRLGKSFYFHAIASESVDGLGCVGACGIPLVCGAFVPGFQYYALADATGGEKISICTADWSMVFGPLQRAVIDSAPLPCDYELPAAPPGSALDPGRVNVEVASGAADGKTLPRATDEAACGSELAWYYDDPEAPGRILMCPGACDALSDGGRVQIKLGCETVSLD